MGGRRVRGLLTIAALLAVGWWIYEKRPTFSGVVDDLTRPLFGSRAAVKESERNRIVGEASQVVTTDAEKPIASLREGMTESEIRRLLGEPDSIEPVEDERGDRTRWIYGSVNRVIVFQRNRVVAIAVR
jgi:hypothetical protein